MHNHIVRLDYPFDNTEALKLAARVKEKSEPYRDKRFPTLRFNHWQIHQFNDSFVEQILKDFDVEGKPRFYWLAPNTSIPPHVDHNTTCSINFVLTEPAAPVTFDNTDYHYKQALLNTSIQHRVTNGPHERILLKISIFNEPYEQLAERIKYKQSY